MKKYSALHTYVTNKHYDITGQEILRIGKHYLISKFSRYEDLSGGPGLKSAILLFVLHFVRRLPGMEISYLERIIRKIFD